MPMTNIAPPFSGRLVNKPKRRLKKAKPHRFSGDGMSVIKRKPRDKGIYAPKPQRYPRQRA